MLGKEFNKGELVSDVATIGNAKSGKVLMINDVSREFFETPMQLNLCVVLSEEDMTAENKRQDMIGYLNQRLYGTRDSAANFQIETQKFIQGSGSKTG